MNWTTSKPTVPGWYWYRKGEEQNPVLVQVQGLGELMTALRPDGRWDAIFSMSLLGEWSGPIEAPPGSMVKPWRRWRPLGWSGCWLNCMKTSKQVSIDRRLPGVG